MAFGFLSDIADYVTGKVNDQQTAQGAAGVPASPTPLPSSANALPNATSAVFNDPNLAQTLTPGYLAQNTQAGHYNDQGNWIPPQGGGMNGPGTQNNPNGTWQVGTSAGSEPLTIGYNFNQTPANVLQGIDQTTQTSNGLIGNATQQGQQNLMAAAGALGQGANTVLGNGYQSGVTQALQGGQGLYQGQQQADYNNQLGQAAAQNFGGLGQQAQQASAYYGTQAGQDRGSLLNSVAGLHDFYTQGPGPSAAEAQLNMATNQAQANAMSLANSGRGAGDNAQAMREAMFTNAATQGNAGLQTALLRANETADWRSKQLAAMGQEQGVLGGLTQGENQQGLNYANLGSDYYKSGVQAQQGYNQQANQALGTGEQYQSSMSGNANTATGQGLSAYTNLTGQGTGLTQAATGVGLQGAGLEASGLQTGEASKLGVQQNQLGTNMQKYGVDKNVALQQQGIDNSKTAAYVQGAATLGGGLLALSDMRAKKNIKPAVFFFERPKDEPINMLSRIAQLQVA